jgi:hypothetical protein
MVISAVTRPSLPQKAFDRHVRPRMGPSRHELPNSIAVEEPIEGMTIRRGLLVRDKLEP